MAGKEGYTVCSDCNANQCKILEDYTKRKRNDSKEELMRVREHLDTNKKRLIDVACERGASAWLSALPLAD